MTSRRHQRRATAKRADVPFERVPKHVVPDEPAAPVLTEPPGLAEPPPLTQNGRRLFEQDLEQVRQATLCAMGASAFGVSGVATALDDTLAGLGQAALDRARVAEEKAQMRERMIAWLENGPLADPLFPDDKRAVVEQHIRNLQGETPAEQRRTP
jgi:DNA-binding transcriptional MerR regulator